MSAWAASNSSRTQRAAFTLGRAHTELALDLEAVLLGATKKGPQPRLAAAELALDEKAFLPHQPRQRQRPVLGHRAPRSCNRRRIAAATRWSVILALLAANFVLWQAKRDGDAAIAGLRRARFRERLALRHARPLFDHFTRASIAKQDDATGGGAQGDGRNAAVSYAIFFTQDEADRLKEARDSKVRPQSTSAGNPAPREP